MDRTPGHPLVLRSARPQAGIDSARGRALPVVDDPEHFSLCQRVRAELDRLGLTNVTLDHWLASVTMKRTRRTKA